MTLEDIIYSAFKALTLPLEYVGITGDNHDKRIHFVYLASSLLLAFYIFLKSRRRSSFVNFLFPKKIWLSKSSFIDYKIFFLNAFIKVFLIAPFLVGGIYLSGEIENFLVLKIGFITSPLSHTKTLIYYTLTLTIFNDFLSFVSHYLFHKVPFLWEFHKIHHSATTLTPLTQYRIHPIELMFNNLKFLFVFGITTGFFEYVSGGVVNKATFFGVNVLSFLFLLWGANLRHSHVKLKYFNFLEHIFISPYQHQIHHSNSPKHYNKNMGSKLALWDWMFGTLLRSNQAPNIKFGLGKKEDKQYNSLSQNILNPFKKLFAIKR